MSREELIHQLSEEMGLTKKVKEEKSRYISATGTMYGNGEEYEIEKQRLEKVQEDDPWSKLELNPVNFK